jgi:hypothetical protein
MGSFATVGLGANLMSRAGEQPDRTKRIQVIVWTDELAAIDAFQFANRIPTRAAAVRELMRRALASPDEQT